MRSAGHRSRQTFGQELIKEGYNGFLYNRESSGDLAQKIILLRQNRAFAGDETKRSEIGRKPLLHTNIRRGIYLYHQFEKSMSEKQAIIVIPVYTTQLTVSEHAALRQCFDHIVVLSQMFCQTRIARHNIACSRLSGKPYRTLPRYLFQRNSRL